VKAPIRIIVDRVVLAVILVVAIGSFCSIAAWQRGWVVAKSDYVQVRKVPIVVGRFALPGSSEYCYVVEVGRYPFETTFRVAWDSYEAKEIVIRLPTREKPELAIYFDDLHKVIGQLGGDVQGAHWATE
jgi:hypothetical protein